MISLSDDINEINPSQSSNQTFASTSNTCMKFGEASSNEFRIDRHHQQFIDLYPIQMEGSFDTYTMILQLGCILNMVPAWSKLNHIKIRVITFVEYP